MPLAKADQTIGADRHGFELFLLIVGLRVIQVIQAIQRLLDVMLEVEHALAVDLIIQYSVPRRALLHELGEDTRLVSRFPIVRHLMEDQLAHGLALPEGYDRILVQLAGSCIHSKGGLFPGIEDIQVLQAMAAQLRISGGSLGSVALFADNQLAFVDADGLVFQDIAERFSPAYLCGPGAAFVLAVELGQQLGALGRDAGRGIQALSSQINDSLCDGHALNLLISLSKPHIITFKPNSRKAWAISARCSSEGTGVSGS